MRAAIILFLCVCCFSEMQAQSIPFVEFKSLESNRKVKLFFGEQYELKIKDNYLSLLHDSIALKHKQLGSVTWELQTVSSDTFYFENGQHINVKGLEWIYSKEKYYANSTGLVVNLALLASFNYLLLKSNEPFAGIFLLNGAMLFTSGALAIAAATNIVYLDKWVPFRVKTGNSNKPQRKGEVNIFDRN